MSCCHARNAPPLAGTASLLRDEEVAGVAVGDVLHLAALAERRNVGRQDDLHAGVASLLIHSRNRGPTPEDSMRPTRGRDRAAGSAARTGARAWASAGGPGRCRGGRPRARCRGRRGARRAAPRDAVEEQVHRQDEHDEIVEAAQDRDVVGDDVAADDEVAERPRPAAPCASAASARRGRATTAAGCTSGARLARGRNAISPTARVSPVRLTRLPAGTVRCHVRVGDAPRAGRPRCRPGRTAECSKRRGESRWLRRRRREAVGVRTSVRLRA